jgi:hypothetical protein
MHCTAHTLRPRTSSHHSNRRSPFSGRCPHLLCVVAAPCCWYLPKTPGPKTPAYSRAPRCHCWARLLPHRPQQLPLPPLLLPLLQQPRRCRRC